MAGTGHLKYFSSKEKYFTLEVSFVLLSIVFKKVSTELSVTIAYLPYFCRKSMHITKAYIRTSNEESIRKL